MPRHETFANGKFEAMDTTRPNTYPSTPNSEHSLEICSSVDGTDKAKQKESIKNDTHSVEVQTEQSSFALLNQYQQSNQGSRGETETVGGSKVQNDEISYSNTDFHEFGTVKLKKTGICCVPSSEMKESLEMMVCPAGRKSDNLKTEFDEPMNYALNFTEYNPKGMMGESSGGESLEGIKLETLRHKEYIGKDPARNKKEMSSNTSRSFKEIFNFFKDRDRRRNTPDSQKIPLPESQKFKKFTTPGGHGVEKHSYLRQTLVEQSDRETKIKNDAHCAQQTPLMFSRCSSLGSLNSFEQVSIHDDHSSVVSEFSRPSGAVSPSDLPSSPTQMTAPSVQSQIGCSEQKQTLPVQNGFKMYVEISNDSIRCNNSSGETCSKEDFVEANDGCLYGSDLPGKGQISKQSIFEDHVTSFKDESTPSRLHSIAASSLSSLTIDDDDIEMSKEDQNQHQVVQQMREDPIGESKYQDPQAKLSPEFKLGIRLCSQEDSREEKDELTDLTPHEEQLLDQYIRKGIAKWTKRNENEIKPFSWDVGLTCRATLTLFTNRIVLNFARKHSLKTERGPRNLINAKNSEVFSQMPTSSISQDFMTQKNFGPTDPGSRFVNYEEDLLDQCIRKGMAKFTRKSVGYIQPFGWDVEQICLTTKSMMLYDQDDTII